eukprot:Selendium_serpulae@DN6304_c0_g2_i3.p1
MSLYDAWIQNIVVAFIVFCCPGFYNALGGLGGAGSSNPSIVTATNALLYGFFAVFGYFGGWFFNLMGPKILLVIGGFTYAFYSLAIWLSGEYEQIVWIAPLSGAILGVGAGFLWTAQGAMTMAYATSELLGTYIAVFWVIFNLGGVMGGMIAFGINFNTTGGEANPIMYFVFVLVMCMGSVLAIFLVVNPQKVKRSDGTMVEFEKAADCKQELKDVSVVMFRKEMLLLSLLFFQSNFFYAYEFGGVNLPIFTVRARSLNSALYWGSQMFGAWVFGQFLMDNKRIGNHPRRALFGFIVSMSFVFVTWIMAIILTYVVEGGYEGKETAGGFGYCWSCEDGSDYNSDCDSSKGEVCCVTDCVDLCDSKRYAFPIITFIFMGIGDAMVQSFAYWIMGAIAGSDTALVARFAGFYKGIQSAGGCISWAIDRPNVSYRIQLWINIILFLITIVPTYFAVRLVPDPLKDRSSVGHEMDPVEKGMEEDEIKEDLSSIVDD